MYLKPMISGLDKDHSLVRKRKWLDYFYSKAEKHLHMLNEIRFSFFFLSYKEFLAASKNHHVFIRHTLTQPKAGGIYFSNWIIVAQ